MPNLTLSLTNELKKEMDSVPEMNWSEVAREAISKRVKEYLLFKELVSKSKLTAKDAKRLSDKINLAVSKKFLEE